VCVCKHNIRRKVDIVVGFSIDGYTAAFTEVCKYLRAMNVSYHVSRIDGSSVVNTIYHWASLLYTPAVGSLIFVSSDDLWHVWTCTRNTRMISASKLPDLS
jgi:predicted 2-oxoglutarate/Fe(II)-dependent dioxygenase YbiX